MKEKISINTIKEQCLQEDIPIISDQTTHFLQKFLVQKQPHCCVEIGSAAGYSSIIIGNTIQKRDGRLYTFEISLPQYKKCIHNLSRYKARNTICYHNDITQCGLKKFIYERVDFAFIDAQKSSYHHYINLLIPLMNQWSTIICDDCIQYQMKMRPLYTYLQKKQIFYQIKKMENNDCIMIIECDDILKQ